MHNMEYLFMINDTPAISKFKLNIMPMKCSLILIVFLRRTAFIGESENIFEVCYACKHRTLSLLLVL
jgi:hypothetical protein